MTKKFVLKSTVLVHSRWLRLAHVLWYPAAAVALGIFIASIPGYIWLIPRGFTEDRFVVNPAPLVLAFNVLFVLLSIASALVSLLLALLLFRRRSEGRMALFLSFYLLAHGILLSGPLEMLEPFWPGIARLTSTMLLPLIFFPLSYVLFTVFPDGRFVPGWTRWGVAAAVMVAPVTSFFTFPLTTYQPDLSNPLVLIVSVITILFSLALFFSMMYAQIYRYRRVSTQKQRQQTKWIIYGIGAWSTFLVIGSIFWIKSYSLPPDTPFPLWFAATQSLWGLSTAIFPVILTISVLRYRLYDIDILINRTLVYGVLTASVVAIYGLVVGASGVLFQTSGNLLISLLATGLVAVFIQPLRERLQRLVNRIMYGERDDPMSVLKKLGQQLEETVSPDSALAGIVETVALALKLPHVAIVTTKNDEKEITASYGESKNERVEIPLIYQAEKIGNLVIAKRGSNEDFSAQEISLLENIARQAGAAVHTVRLMADLQRSRQHLVTTREEERRRLRRDLHDGLGASLAALHLQTGALRRAIEQDPELAKTMVDEFKSELHEAIADIRRVAYELRPPALDELGLTGALHAQAARFRKPSNNERREISDKSSGGTDLDVQIEAPKKLPQLPAAVEVAVYRIVQEALTNVVNHAHARHCVVRLHLDNDFQVEILDNGIGISADQSRGIGLSSMCERATELGGTCIIEPASSGGTRVIACFPIPQRKG